MVQSNNKPEDTKKIEFKPAKKQNLSSMKKKGAQILDEVATKKTELYKIQRKDYEWKVAARKIYGRILIALLILQNIAVFTLVFWAFISGKLGDLQTVFSILVPATLGETAFMVKTIIEWLFKDINYPE
jgi:hypothetical protein